MGSALVSAVENKEKPTVGLLNIGEEDIKGNEVVKQTAKLLRADHEKGLLNFYGNVEGNDILKGTTDVVVCDGFVGNVALKAIEGTARFFKNSLLAEFKSNPLNMLGAFIARGAIKGFSRRMNPSRYNGASLLGLRGLVLKSHGSADAKMFEGAIKRAFDAANHDVLSRVSTTIAALLPQSEIIPEASNPISITENIGQKTA
jgi:glycerol-3-phosphate acyltransferase PlsX